MRPTRADILQESNLASVRPCRDRTGTVADRAAIRPLRTAVTTTVLRNTSVAVFGMLVMAVLSNQAASPYEVGTWRGFRRAAISFTYDDSCANQFTVAIPMFDHKGLKLTLFTCTGTMFPGWLKLQNAAAAGHEIASHTVTHANFSGLSDAQQTNELKNSLEAINANVTNQRCVTMAYPYCATGKESIAATYYVAARTCSGRIVPSTPADFMDISSFSCGSLGSLKTLQDFTNNVNHAATQNGWSVYLIHGIDGDGGYSPLPSATLQETVDFFGANRDRFWVETFGNVVRYIKERNAAVITETVSNAERITLKVADTLDDAIFNYPITVRRPLPANWTGAAVSQNSQSVPAQTVTVNSTNYIMFDVVPNAGEVVIARSQ